MIKNKVLITVVSGLIFIPAITIGSIVGIIFEWWLNFGSRYESFAFAQSIFVGACGGALAGWLVQMIVGNKENRLYMLIAPIIMTILLASPIFYPINLNDDWSFILSSYSALLVYACFIIYGD